MNSFTNKIKLLKFTPSVIVEAKIPFIYWIAHTANSNKLEIQNNYFIFD